MKKFLSAALIALVVAFSANVSAAIVEMDLVRISDYNVHDFYINFNRIARDVMTNNVFMNKYPEKIDAWSDANYDVYVTACTLATEPGGTVVLLYANKEGHVSYLKVIVGRYGNVTNGTFTNLFATIGMTIGEMKSTFRLMSANDNVVTRCASTDRNIIIQTKDAEGVQAKEITIFALKEK